MIRLNGNILLLTSRTKFHVLISISFVFKIVSQIDIIFAHLVKCIGNDLGTGTGTHPALSYSIDL